MAIALAIINQEDIPAVAALAGSAFKDDAVYLPELPRGSHPVVYDDVAKHAEWMRDKVYYKCTKDDALIGSLILEFQNEHASIFGLHVDPQFMNQGIGSWILRTGMGLWPNVSLWSLETPDYAVRNHSFYEKNGFWKVSQSVARPEVGFGFIRYEKHTQQGNAADAYGATDL